MRISLLASAIVLGLCSQVFADDIEFQSGTNAPLRLHHVKPIIIIHQGTKPIQIMAGKTPVDKLTTVNCRNAGGCLITAKAFVTLAEANGASLAFYVDNAEINPEGPPGIEGNLLVDQASKVVALGIHTIQTMMYQDSAFGETGGWNIEYIVYGDVAN